jgi:UDP-perosamine 4-acetyltransferase
VTDASSVLVFGGGGHAKVVVDVLQSMGQKVVACLDFRLGDPILGVPVLDQAIDLDRLIDAGYFRAFVAIGDNARRQLQADRARESGLTLVNAISPRAYVAPSVTLGSGILIVHGAVVNACSELGDDVIINTSASVDHDNVIGSGVHVGPGTHLAGSVTIGAGAFVGAGSVVIPGITIGQGAAIGAGSVVVRDVVPHHRSWGNPARDMGSIATHDD